MRVAVLARVDVIVNEGVWERVIDCVSVKQCVGTCCAGL